MQDQDTSKVPAGADPEANAKLAEAWKELEEKMQQLCNKCKDAEYDGNLSPADVIARLDAMDAAAQKKNEKWGRTKAVLNNTLEAVSSIGGLVASGASNVFAPAGPCYNALNFVIVGYQNYQSMFDGLGDLFSDCNSFLQRLTKYTAANMSAEMSETMCKVLSIFVDICDVALKLRDSRSFRFKSILKVTFTTQNDVARLLAEMNKVADEEKLSALADIYLSSAEAAGFSKRAVNLLEENREEAAEGRKEKKDTKILLGCLAFKEVLEGASTPAASWGTIYEHLRHHRVTGTGKWLLDHPSFNAWKRRDGGAPPILGIVGGEASGKTYLVSTAISHLRKEGSGEGAESRNSRHLVAYYFLNEKRANSGADTLGKSIIWQLAQSDVSYLQSAAMTCTDVGGIDPTDVLTALLLDNRKQLKQIDATFYIVINKIGAGDGNVHPGVLNFLKALSQSKSSRSKGPAVRVLFTATQKTLDYLERNDLSCPTISMKENRDDIDRYIDSRMNKMDFLYDTEDARVSALRKQIRDRLRVNTKSNYYMIDNALQEISSADFDSDILKSVDNAGNSTLGQHIANDLAKLNTSCKSGEIKEINEIILWVTFAQERMTVEKMNAVLRYKNNGAVPLRPLEERLKKRFLLFEISNDNCVDFRSHETLDTIPKRGDIANARQKSNELVQQEEVNIVEYFLHTVCPPALFDKLNLNDYFAQKLKAPQEQIYQEDENSAHFRLAEICIRVLADENGENLRVLRGYASRNLVQHMSQVDLALIAHESKHSIGSDLVGLFRRGFAIDNLFWAKKPTPEFPTWILEKRQVEHIVRWLKDPAVVSQIGEQADNWVKELMADEQNIVKALVEPSVIRMAEYTFKKESSEDITLAAFRIVREFITRFDGSSTENAQEGPKAFSQVEAWCQRKLPIVGKSEKERSLWHSQMAIVLNGHSAKSEAEARCHQALSLDKKNWRASLLLVKIMKDNEKAIDIVKSLIKRFEGDARLLGDHKDSFAEMVYILGTRYWDQGKSEKKALEQFSACIKDGLANYSLVLDILSRYRAAGHWDQIIDLIQNLSSQGRLPAMVIAMATEEEFHVIILRAVLKTGRDDIFDEVYRDAVETAKKRNDRRVVFHLRRFYASALWARRDSPTDQVLELLEHAAQDVPYTRMKPEDAFFFLGYRLGTIYLKRARAAGNNQDEAKHWLQRMTDIIPESVKEDQMRLPLCLFAARYHLVSNNREAAKRTVHNTLKMAVELLSDKDTSNDILAYSKILFAVVPFGHLNHAAAALAMTKLEGPPGGLLISCSCKCGGHWDTSSELYWCQDCIRVALLPKCYAKVKDTARVSHVCDASHEHIRIPAWDQEKMAKLVGTGDVPWGDKVVSMEKWLGMLISDYSLTKA